ncbi:hypothetical protein VD0001_g2607 [Verticillium dahliae]|uniref:Uncharacterized protein n=1 Tax=Verticillium dahliae TaxID=27337 RepID=A0A444S0I5_VERDA|nr:hypothetical protein VD0001_g2607 [Verticillium dahliae]RXG46900.1 hypothetical protein VDGE_06042 [Verticillium dahliae]
MDIHRCRFVPYPPSPINALAFSRPSTRSTLQASLNRLAVGRANGDIELWNPSSGAWHQEKIIHGGNDRSVDGLVWVVEPDEELPHASLDTPADKAHISPGRSRLFSIGYTSAVTEWDLEKGRPLRTASGQHGDIWCIAAQPAPTGNKALASPSDGVSKLVAGTIDGALAIYTIVDSDLRFQRLLVKSPARKTQMVSIAFQSRDVVVVGCSDSTLRAYDMRNGLMLRKMTLGADLAGGSKEIIVWSVKCLPNGDIVSGDSTGHVTIWDGKTYTQMQRLQSHRQDVLSLAASNDGTALLSGGMDRRTVLYKKTAGASSRWGKVWSRKYHDHDVKAMASFESAKMSVVVSGGPDASPVVLPLKELGRENHRTLQNLPQQPPLQSAPKARLIVSWWDREVNIWKLRQTFDGIYNNDAEDVNKNRKLLKTILIKGESSISAASISPDGSVLAVATATEFKAFHLQHQNPTKPSDIRLSQIEVPASLANNGANLVQISPDGNWLVAIQDGTRMLLLRIRRDTTSDEAPTLARPQNVTRMKRKIPKHLKLGGLGNYERSITHATFAPDSKMLAVADLAGYIDTWVLRSDGETDEDDDASSDSDFSESEADVEEADDAMGSKERWQHTPASTLLPKLPAPPVVLSFAPEASDAPYTLLAVTNVWHILAFNPLEGGLTPWSRRNPSARLPNTIRDTRDLAKGILWQGPRAWIYGVSFLFMLDLSQDLSDPSAASTALTTDSNASALAKAGQKRKRKGAESGAGNRMAIGSLVPQQVDRYVSGKDWQTDLENAAAATRSEGSDTDMADADQEEEDDNDDEDNDNDDLSNESEHDALAALRNRDTQMDASSGSGRKKWWYTYKYRPILGIVALDPAGDGAAQPASESDDSTDLPSLEAVLVERPLWDVDLPERYFGANEAERR